MLQPLLETKLRIPQVRAALVPRPRLLARLNDHPDRKLTLVSAPAGFGKTTLIVSWVRELDRPVAWLSLERADDDPVRAR